MPGLLIRHCVEESNIDENMLVLDPTRVRHVVVVAGMIKSMSGMIDPASHLNLDYPDHKVTSCIVAEKFEIGAKVKMQENGLVFVLVDSSKYEHYGYVDYTQRLFNMIDAVKKGSKDRHMNRRQSPVSEVS
jgi:hypothetical protein